MKIIEAMKELKLIEKKMARNNELIIKYCAQPSSDRLYFETAEAQKKEVKSLIQSNTDLMKDYIALKIRIDQTNLVTIVTLQGKDSTIAELLIMKRKMAKAMIATYESLTDTQFGLSHRIAREDRVQVERFYDESYKNENLREWQDLYESIDSRLEVVNATTDLVNE